MRSPRIVFSLAAAAVVLAAIPAASAIGQGLRGSSEQRDVQAQSVVGSGFTYQGRLIDGGVLPTGVYDLRFVLYDSEVGGAQVPGTPIVTKDDVQVSTGLFSTTLDFGDTVFDGEARWIELAIKPGSSGTFTVLNPRQPVMPVPQAMYAQTAGNISLPIASEGTTSSGGVLSVKQLGSGSALIGTRAYEGNDSASGVHGENSGAGSGVSGVSNHQSGVGVSGNASGLTGIGGSFTGKTGVLATGLDAASTALEVNGALKVSGVNRFAFVHTPGRGELVPQHHLDHVVTHRRRRECDRAGFAGRRDGPAARAHADGNSRSDCHGGCREPRGRRPALSGRGRLHPEWRRRWSTGPARSGTRQVGNRPRRWRDVPG